MATTNDVNVAVQVDVSEILKNVLNVRKDPQTYQQALDILSLILDRNLYDPGELAGALNNLSTQVANLAASQQVSTIEITSQINSLERVTNMTKEELLQIKSDLETSTSTISEIAGDMAELKNTGDQLTAKVAELEATIAAMPTPDPALDALVSDIKGLAASQASSLRSIADVVPELTAPEEPTTPVEPETPVEPAPPVEPTEPVV